MERETGLKRRLVLAVLNVVAAIGLVGLMTYAFLGTSGDKPQVATASGPTLRIRIAEQAPQLVMEDVIRVSPVVAAAPTMLRAAIDGTNAQLSNPTPAAAPVSTGAVVASFEVRRLVIGPDSGSNTPSERPIIRQASLSPSLGFNSRDVLNDSDPFAVPEEPSGPDNLLQENGITLRPGRVDPTSSVPLVRLPDGNAALKLGFTPPAFVIRDVEADDRADLIEAEAVANKKHEEKSATKTRRLDRQRYCMAAAIYYEARSESHSGQRAVAQVVMNRVASKRYPNTICGVVFQGEDRRNRCQFSFACDGRPERPRPGKSWNNALSIAKQFEGGDRYAKLADATHYHADYVKPRWSSSMRRISKIGRHIFLNGI